MERAIRGGDATGFFSAYRTAVQERLGDLWGVQPLAITVADVRRRIPDAMGLRDVFETADAVAYSGRTYTQNELRNYMKALKKEIATLGHGS